MSSLLAGWMGLAGSASANDGSCITVYEPSAGYPMLIDQGHSDISGEAGVVLYLQAERALVEVDGCLYELGERGLEVDFAGLDFVNLFIELPDHPEGASINVTIDDAAPEVLEIQAGSFVYSMHGESSLGFAIEDTTALTPTVPVVVRKPIEDDPEPD